MYVVLSAKILNYKYSCTTRVDIIYFSLKITSIKAIIFLKWNKYGL